MRRRTSRRLSGSAVSTPASTAPSDVDNVAAITAVTPSIVEEKDKDKEVLCFRRWRSTLPFPILPFPISPFSIT